MKNAIIIIILTLLFTRCANKKEEGRDFFKMSNNIKTSKINLSFVGLDSLVLYSLSTFIDNKNYWYLSSATNGLLNICGYLRREGDIIFIKATDNRTVKNVPEQVFLDFAADAKKSIRVKFNRNYVQYYLTIIKQIKVYNKLINDSAVIFRIYFEEKNSSLTKEFLMQASLKKGFISFRYLSETNKKIYTIDFLPIPNVTYHDITDTIYSQE
jgi:hypothetical protein